MVLHLRKMRQLTPHKNFNIIPVVPFPLSHSMQIVIVTQVLEHSYRCIFLPEGPMIPTSSPGLK